MTKPIASGLLAAACLAASAAVAAEDSHCMNDRHAEGMQGRMATLHAQMEKAQTLSDPAEQRRMLELHAKHMREGMRELRRREQGLQPGCHLELMRAMMEQLAAHQQAAQELEAR